MWLVPIVLNSTGQKDIFRTTLRILLVKSLSIFKEKLLERKRGWVMEGETISQAMKLNRYLFLGSWV